MEAEAEEMVFEDAGRDRASRKAHSLQKLEKPGSGFSPRTSRGDVWPPELENNSCVLFQATEFVAVSYRSSKKLAY